MNNKIALICATELIDSRGMFEFGNRSTRR
jgi:hypothetical protein